ncbi:MAG: patatin-like phospholipase family protein [Moraxellaceae bacterium]|nr:patatin-like phospholipase family protein [Moraxellaceae bacterium]
MNQRSNKRTGLILSGGGARAAYQVGVLRAVADIMPQGCHNPFEIICGTSAGGLNAAGLATHADCLHDGISMLETVWGEFRTHQVYRTDWPGVLHRAARWLWTMAFGRMRRDLPVSLLDNSPLRGLLDAHIPLERIQQAIDNGYLDALCITASGYSTGESISFFQGVPHLDGWNRSRRVGIRTAISIDHLLASAAIPMLFPAVRVNREYFGDGAVRQHAPISPALHLGAERVMVIGVGGQPSEAEREKSLSYPSIAQIVSHILSSSFVDSLESDIERLTRINKTISLIPEEARHQSTLRPVDVMVITPSAQVLDTIAMRHADALPKSIRMFVRGSGATQRSGSGVLSYLLFEAAYCKELIQLGYLDGCARKDEMKLFFNIADTPSEKPASNVVEFKRG